VCTSLLLLRRKKEVVNTTVLPSQQLQCWIQLGSHQEEPWQTVLAPNPRLPSAMAGPLPKEASQELVLAGT